jgi:hypothetical protein
MEGGQQRPLISCQNDSRRACPNLSEPSEKDTSMTVRIENQTCFFTIENGEEIRLCTDVTIITDAEKAMSAWTSTASTFTSPKLKPTH